MKTIVLAFPGNEHLAQALARQAQFTHGEFEFRRFPDGETFIRVLSNVEGKQVLILCTLDRPDDKFLPLYFLAKALRESGAEKIELVSPYLAYMRQDKQFHSGEAVTSDAFASLLSGFIDRLITVDPHLHRRHHLSEIYSIPAVAVKAADTISKWIKSNVTNPIVIGPDEESRQWVEAVANGAGIPFEVLRKVRSGDRDVEVSIPQVDKYAKHTPVLIDDIISTAHTMIETIDHLKKLNMKPATCIGVHAIFAGDAFNELKRSGAGQIITCNTILHETNGIDISEAIMAAVV